MRSFRLEMRKTRVAARVWMCAALLALPASTLRAQRVTVSLDGTWSVADGNDPEAPPAGFTQKVPVPGLAHSATPAFPDVDRYSTDDFVWTMKRHGVLPATYELPARTPQKRNYFWYQRTFRTPARKERALLVVNKAQFGTAVWLNGKKAGEHLGCFTAGYFDLTGAIDWNGDNRLLIRIGAHPGALPQWAPFGTDGEKELWTPGIYDSVSLRLSGDPVIVNVQVAPRIQSTEILVETELVNHGAARTVLLTQRVKTWKQGRMVGNPTSEKVLLAAGERKRIRQNVAVPGAVLWTPADPFLYVLETDCGSDSAETRFGMREFRFNEERALLNGKVIFLRGASITLHRFFGDAQSGRLPWDEAWVRKFLVDIPRGMHWNAFRICIGPVPQRWLDVADEAGLLLQYEFPIWSDREPFYYKLWKEEEVLAQLKEFMADNWNHPSVVLWDASNETRWPFLADKAVPALRGLDLSSRPWENGYNEPALPGNPYEVHPYKFSDHTFGKGPRFFEMADLEKTPQPAPKWPGHAAIINEYDWLWLHRDGTPTVLSKKAYTNLLGANVAAGRRVSLAAYLLAGLTEHWRAFRQHAGVLYLAYLDGDVPNAFTCDNFRDVRTLELQPDFQEWMGEAFKPLGVCLHFWQPGLKAGARRCFRIMMVNDVDERLTGKVRLILEPAAGGKSVASAETVFDLSALGEAQIDLELAVPQAEGAFVLKAVADAGKPWGPTVSRRNLSIIR